MINLAINHFGRENLSKLRILDPSSGWGDRLIAALALNAESYTGYDPNFELKLPYNNILKDLIPLTKPIIDIKNYTLNIQPFDVNFSNSDIKSESFIINKNKKFNFVFTSPPFYDMELYHNGDQSITGYKTYKEWVEGWYKKYIETAFELLESKGLIAIYIEDWREYKLGTDTQKILTSLDAKFISEYKFSQSVLNKSGKFTLGPMRSLWVFTKM